MSLGTREPLFADNWLVDHDYDEEVLGVLKTGKESEVRLIARRGGDRTSYIAEKRFKATRFRSFRDNAVYRGTWFQSPGADRARRAVLGKTRRGREILDEAWYSHEWNELRHLHEAGVTVPPPVEDFAPSKPAPRTFHWRPINAAPKGGRDEDREGGYRMAFIGEAPAAAPRLSSIRLATADATRVWNELLEEIRLMLRAERVHGDLSAYNVLYWRERPVLIDFSQTVDVVTHPGARELLRRDVERLAAYFRKQGVDADTHDAWIRLNAERALEGRG